MSYQLRHVADHMDKKNLNKYSIIEEIPEHLKKKKRTKFLGIFSQQNAESANF